MKIITSNLQAFSHHFACKFVSLFQTSFDPLILCNAFKREIKIKISVSKSQCKTGYYNLSINQWWFVFQCEVRMKALLRNIIQRQHNGGLDCKEANLLHMSKTSLLSIISGLPTKIPFEKITMSNLLIRPVSFLK